MTFQALGDHVPLGTYSEKLEILIFGVSKDISLKKENCISRNVRSNVGCSQHKLPNLTFWNMTTGFLILLQEKNIGLSLKIIYSDQLNISLT